MFRNPYDGVWGLAPSAEGGRASDTQGVSGVQGRSPWKKIRFLTSLLIENALEYEHTRFEFTYHFAEYLKIAKFDRTMYSPRKNIMHLPIHHYSEHILTSRDHFCIVWKGSF